MINCIMKIFEQIPMDYLIFLMMELQQLRNKIMVGLFYLIKMVKKSGNLLIKINGDIGLVKWVRVIEDEIFIEKIISLVKNKTCTN